MSRKREKQRESRRELARQLGVDARDVPEELRSHARVCEPEMKLRLYVERARRGFLARALPMDVHAALFVIDNQGPRLARAQHWRGVGQRAPSDVPVVTASEEEGEPKVRYTRPGHFFLVLLVTEGASAEEAHTHRAALADAQHLVLEAGTRRGHLLEVTSPQLERPTTARLFHQTASEQRVLPTGAHVRFGAAAVLRMPAAHRVEEDVVLPLVSADGDFAARADVHLRL